MSETTTLSVIARDDDDFDDLCTRAAALFGTEISLDRSSQGRSMTYRALLLRRFESNPETLVVTLVFDGFALKMLGVDLDGRAALDAAANVTKH